MKYLTILLFLSMLPLAARTETPIYKIRVAAVQVVEQHQTMWLRVGPGKKPVKISLNTRVFSNEIKYRGGSVARFYASAKAASAREATTPIAKARLTSKSNLLIFSAQGKNTKNRVYRTYAIEDGSFPFGSFRLVNFSKLPVLATIGGKKSLVAPRKSASFAFRSDQNGLPVRLVCKQKGKKSRIIRQTSWSIYSSQRELVIMLPNRKNGLIRIIHLMDARLEADEDEV